MWYMYMMAGIYFLTPSIILVKNHMAEHDFRKMTVLFLIWASVSSWTSRYLLSWDLGRSFLYVGYFMMGYIIRKYTKDRKNNFLGICLIMIGIMIELFTAYIQYIHILQGIAEQDEIYALVQPQTPWIMCASVVIFWGFSSLDFRWDWVKLSSHTFYIYLFHAGVWDIMLKVIKYFKKDIANSMFAIPCGVTVVFVISYILSIGCRRFGRYINRVH